MRWLSYFIYYFAYLTYLISGLSLYQHYLYSIKLAAVGHIPFGKRKYICLENCKVAAGAWLVQYIYKRQSSCQPFNATSYLLDRWAPVTPDLCRTWAPTQEKVSGSSCHGQFQFIQQPWNQYAGESIAFSQVMHFLFHLSKSHMAEAFL